MISINQVTMWLAYFLIFISHVAAREDVRRKFCPRSCTCDIFEGLKRADCSQQRLIHAQTDVPDMVEILDLSRNEISGLNDRSFQVRYPIFLFCIYNDAIKLVSTCCVLQINNMNHFFRTLVALLSCRLLIIKYL